MEQKIFEKEYSIPYELFEKAFTQWQKKFVYPKTYTISILFLAIAVVLVQMKWQPSYGLSQDTHTCINCS